MKDETLLLRIEPETKRKLLEIAEKERRSMTSLILFLIDSKIQEVQNGSKN